MQWLSLCSELVKKTKSLILKQTHLLGFDFYMFKKYFYLDRENYFVLI